MKADILRWDGFPISYHVVIFSDLACKPCINYQVESNTLPPQAAGVVQRLHLNLLKDPTCNRIGTCTQPSNREKVSKCAVYQGEGTLTLKPGKLQ